MKKKIPETKIAVKQGMATYKRMGTGGCGYGKDRKVHGVKQ